MAACRRFSQIFADLVLNLRGKWFGAAENRRKPQKIAGNRRISQEAVSTPFSHLVSPSKRCPTKKKTKEATRCCSLLKSPMDCPMGLGQTRPKTLSFLVIFWIPCFSLARNSLSFWAFFHIFPGVLSRADSSSVDFGREAPKFWFEFGHRILDGFSFWFFPRKKAPKKSTKKSTTKFESEIRSIKSPRISAEAFSWHFRGSVGIQKKDLDVWWSSWPFSPSKKNQGKEGHGIPSDTKLLLTIWFSKNYESHA